MHIHCIRGNTHEAGCLALIQQRTPPQYLQYLTYMQHFTAALFFIVCQYYHVRRDQWSKCKCSLHDCRCHINLSWMPHLEASSLRRRNASSAGPRLMSTACGAWRPIRLLTEASPSDRLERERDEATRDKPASLTWLQKRKCMEYRIEVAQKGVPDFILCLTSESFEVIFLSFDN